MRLTHLTIIATIIITVVSILLLPHMTEAQKPVIVPILAGKYPVAIAVNPNTNMIYVANADDNTTSVIDGKTSSVVKTIPVGRDPEGVAVNPNTNTVYVANARSHTVLVFP